MTHDDQIQWDTKIKMNDFNETPGKILHNAYFLIDVFNSMYLEDVNYDKNSGVEHQPGIIPYEEKYGGIITNDNPEPNDGGDIYNHLNKELIIIAGMNNEWHRHL